MATTQQKREWWADWRCNPLKMVSVAFPGPDRVWNLPVADKAAPAFELFASLMRKHNYLFREVSGGTYNCRFIGGTESWSLHAYGIAIDLNPSKNPYGTKTHNFPKGFIDDVTATGLFRWGYSFSDPMHWEIDVPPSAIGDAMTHRHIPMPEDLPRSWADNPWAVWVARSGTDPNSRTWDFYREDLSWVYDRVIRPLETKVAALEAKVALLQSGGSGSDAVARSEAARAHSRLDGIRVPK
jgi:hypothetical protein